ncbi:MAG: uS8 family ribosomal protein [Candidatus Magasanikbacteria bacterium]
MSYIDLITRINNSQNTGDSFLKMPYSKMDKKIAELLEKEGYIDSVEVKGKRPNKVLKIRLKPEKSIKGFEFLSKPSRRRYKGYRDLWPVKGGYGTLVVSTPEGIKSGKDARENKVGGQILFEIW